MTEADELASDLRAVYGEMHPTREPDLMRISDDVIALGILRRREIRAAKPEVPFYRATVVDGRGNSASSVANLRTRTLDRLAKHNSRDPE